MRNFTAHPGHHRPSPVPGLGLEGYADEMTAPAGGRVRFKEEG